jgi:hypothetical protein
MTEIVRALAAQGPQAVIAVTVLTRFGPVGPHLNSPAGVFANEIFQVHLEAAGGVFKRKPSLHQGVLPLGGIIGVNHARGGRKEYPRVDPGIHLGFDGVHPSPAAEVLHHPDHVGDECFIVPLLIGQQHQSGHPQQLFPQPSACREVGEAVEARGRDPAFRITDTETLDARRKGKLRGQVVRVFPARPVEQVEALGVGTEYPVVRHARQTLPPPESGPPLPGTAPSSPQTPASRF